MRFGEIDIPKPLVDAQRTGELVVFAGAGVSMPSPSDFPDFDLLADQIAAGTLTREGSEEAREPVDRFLGRLADRGTKVHEVAKRILSNPKSRPNELHHLLLSLFETVQNVRLVTTNFDDHFSTAAREGLAGGLLKVYCAPALPLGDRFHGLVHLHGNVREDAESLVLTDSDFGRAYLTEGWATRFLQALFPNFTVLFVGYSHNDPVMSYLARGITAGSTRHERFAFTEDAKHEHWKYLGIRALPYRDGEHAAIKTTLSRWCQRVSMKSVDHNGKIKAIVEKPVPPDDEVRDYIAEALTDPSRTRHFAQYARRLDWLNWIEDQTPFLRLFDTGYSPSGADAEVATELAYWFGRTFAFSEQNAAMDVLVRKGGSPWHEDEYVVSNEDAQASFRFSRARIIFFGHTHRQVGWSLNKHGVTLLRPGIPAGDGAGAFELRLEQKHRYLLNPGSVGQPRDGDWRAAFGVFDEARSSFTWFRVPYKVIAAQRAIRRAGLPDALATRLKDGT